MCLVRYLNFFDLIGKHKKMIYCLLLSGVLWFVLSFLSLSYCVQFSSLAEFESTMPLILSQMPANNDNYKALTKLFNSNAWASNKLILPFDTYNNLIIRCWKDTSVVWYIDFLFYNSNATYNVTDNYITANNNISCNRYRFDIINLSNSYNPYYDGNTTENFRECFRKITTNYKFGMFFCGSTFINAQNYDVWGYNYPILDYYSYNYNSNLSDIVVDDFNTMKQIDISDKLTNIADFGRTSHFSNAYITYWAYKKDLGYFEPYTTVATTSFNIINTDLGEIYFTSDEFLANTVMQFVLVSNDLDNFSSLSISYYCVDNNTVIVNGELDTTNTFNNNYYNRYRYDLSNFTNTNSGGIITNLSGDTTGFIDLSPISNGIKDINDTLTDSSQVDSVLDNYNSSGEILDALGYQTIGQTNYGMYLAPILYVVNTINDTLLSNDDPYFDIPLRDGTVKRIFASDFTTPETLLKNFVRYFMIFVTLYVVYLRFKEVIEIINSGNAINVLHTEDADMYFFKM